MTRILVLGAQGLLGHHTAAALRAAGYDVVRGGRRPELALDFRLIDFDSSDSMRAALEGVAITVSSVEDPDTRFEREVLKRGGLFLSQATIPADARRALATAGEQTTAGSVILNAGLSGVGGLIANELLERHAEADTLELAYIISTGGSGGLAGAGYIHRLLTAQSGLATTQCLFPRPFGQLPCFDLSRNDEIWLSPAMMTGRSIRPCLSIAEPWLRNFLLFANRRRFLHRLPASLFTVGVKLKSKAKPLTREPMRVRVAAYRGVQLLEATGIDAEGDYNSTVQSTLVFVKKLLEQPSKAVTGGVSSVEDIFQWCELNSEMENEGFVVGSISEN